MTTVQSKVTDGQDLVPFFYLRITGFPFYVFATTNPSDSRYGSFAWSAPTGFPSTWAQRGLQLPSQSIDQKFTDIIGGIASPASCKLSVMDFADPLHPGFGFFSRQFAPGRALSDSSVLKSQLANGVTAVPGEDSVLEIVGDGTTVWGSSIDVYLGAETIGLGSVTAPDELPFIARNKYVCFGNSGDGGTYWPPTPYHRVIVDASASITSAPIVSTASIDTIGRTAALWMGHMRPDGNPEPESASACLLLGRITGVEVGSVGGVFDITINSILADLTNGLVAPDLGHGTIQDGFYLANPAWCSFFISGGGATFKISITPGIYATAQALADEVSNKIAATGDSTLRWIQLLLVNGADGPFFQFSATKGVASIIVSSVAGDSNAANTYSSAAPAQTSLIYVLGFDPTVLFVRVDSSTDSPAVIAPRVAAHVFVPTLDLANANALLLSEANASDAFFTNQGDGTGIAWGRFGDGSLVKVTAIGSNAVTTGASAGSLSMVTGTDASDSGWGRFYYVEPSQTATLDQVILLLENTNQFVSARPSATQFFGMMLASTTGLVQDGIINALPKGAGLGWAPLMSSSEWLQNDETSVQRLIYLTSAVKFTDIFLPYARQHGLFLVWDPSVGKISLRRFLVPSKASTSANVSFTESNRAQTTDRTTQKSDRSSLRTSWKIQPAFTSAGLVGWRAGPADNFSKPPPLIINDVRARSMYPNDSRQESIDDPTLISYQDLGATIARLLQLYDAPWTLCQRSMNKRGMLLAPGTYHQVIDNTMVNPFTGAAGIVSTDSVYCFLSRVGMTPSTGEVAIEFFINSTDNQALYRQWSPTGLVDFTANSAGFTHGYNASTKTLQMTAHYGSPLGANDALSFETGDKVLVRARDNSDPLLTSEVSATVASIGSTTIVLTTDITSVSTVSETVVMLQKYNSATTSRQTGASAVSWQGNGNTHLIQGTATANLDKWS